MPPVTVIVVAAVSSRSSLSPTSSPFGSPSIIPLPVPKMTIGPVDAVAVPETPSWTITLSSIEIEVPLIDAFVESKWNVLPDPTMETGPVVVKLATSSAPPARGARRTTFPWNEPWGEWKRCCPSIRPMTTCANWPANWVTSSASSVKSYGAATSMIGAVV